MKSLSYHCNQFAATFDSFADRPIGIVPEKLETDSWDYKDILAVFITVEEGDDINKIPSLFAREIQKMADNLGLSDVVILPFAHLSNNLAGHEFAKKFLDLVEQKIENKKVHRVHFGSHKSILLDVPGHVGNVMYREF